MRISDWSSDVCSSDVEPLSMMFKTPFAGKKLTLDVRVVGRVMIVSDRPLLMRALANLLSNSYKYTNSGGANRTLAPHDGSAVVTTPAIRAGLPDAPRPPLDHRHCNHTPHNEA